MRRKFSFNTFQIVVLGFAGIILIGTFLLMLPVSSSEKVVTPFIDALFTSTTSVCVTGLVVHNTGTYWSSFGQVIIFFLIQIGGLGIITVAASFAMMAGWKFSLFQRSAMQEAVAAPHLGGIVKLIIFVIKTTFIIEAIGASVMAPVFIRDFGLWKGIWMAIFHSVSAFCNAGIDLLGVNKPFSSLTAYIGNPVINFTIMGLIIIGGLGFLTWDDIHRYGIRFSCYRMQSKVILTATGLLIFIPAIFFFLLEFKDLPFTHRIMASLFQAVTTRTAGFNTANLADMTESGQLTMIVLMLIGGSPGSTAGGMKTTTIAVLIACAISVFRQRDSVTCFGRRIFHEIVYSAITVALLYTVLCITGAIIISLTENLSIFVCLYETASAIGTVGLSLGITPGLGLLSKCILIFLMYIGRVGGLTLVYATLAKQKTQVGKLPVERITVG